MEKNTGSVLKCEVQCVSVFLDLFPINVEILELYKGPSQDMLCPKIYQIVCSIISKGQINTIITF